MPPLSGVILPFATTHARSFGSVIRIAGNRARDVMPTGDSTHLTGALHRLRRHWFAPARPIAVDDEPHWLPAADPGESSGLDSDHEQSATATAQS
jgi:hypothetical protein